MPFGYVLPSSWRDPSWSWYMHGIRDTVEKKLGNVRFVASALPQVLEERLAVLK